MYDKIVFIVIIGQKSLILFKLNRQHTTIWFFIGKILRILNKHMFIYIYDLLDWQEEFTMKI